MQNCHYSVQSSEKFLKTELPFSPCTNSCDQLTAPCFFPDLFMSTYDSPRHQHTTFQLLLNPHVLWRRKHCISRHLWSKWWLIFQIQRWKIPIQLNTWTLIPIRYTTLQMLKHNYVWICWRSSFREASLRSIAFHNSQGGSLYFSDCAKKTH